MYAFAQHLSNRLYLKVILITVVLAALMMTSYYLPAHLLTWEGAAALLGCGLLYGVSQRIGGSILDGHWTGYAATAASIAWMSLDIQAALIMVIVVTLVNSLLDRFLRQREQIAYRAGAHIAINGIHILGGYLTYVLLFNRTPPVIVGSVGDYLPVVGALIGAATASLITGILYTGQIPSLTRARATQMVLLDTLLGVLTPVLPLILTQISGIAFFIVMVLLTAQAIRYHQVSDARQALEQRVREMSAVDTLSTTISADLDTQSLLRDVYNVLKPIINFETLFIALYDPGTQKIDYASVIHDGQPVTWQPRQLQNGLTDFIIRRQEPLLINRDQAHLFAQLEIEPDDVTSAAYAGVPMKINGQFVGVLSVLHGSDATAFDDDTVMILRAVASQAGLAVRNAALYERNVTLADNLNLINNSLQSIMFNLDRDSALDHAVKIAAEIAGTDAAAIYLMDCGGTCLKVHHQIGLDPVDIQQTIPFRPDQFPDGSLIINDTEDQTAQTALSDMIMAARYRSGVEVPLQSGNTLIGFLAVYSDQPRIYPHYAVQMMELIASQITAALDNAELLEALELYAAEQAQLVHLARIATSSLDLDKLIQDVSDMLAQMFNMQQVIIGLANSDTRRMSFVTPVGGELPTLITENLTDDIPEFVAALSHKQPHVHTYLLSDELSSPLRRLMTKNRVNTLVVMPLINNQNLIGVVIMGASHPVIINDNERRMLEMASHQISTQMQNARIYELTEESLVRRLEELSLLEEVAQKITQTLEIDRLIENVLEASMQATQADFASIALLNTRKNCFDIIQYELIDGKPVSSRDTKSLEDGVIGYVARTGKSQIIPDNQAVKYYMRANDNLYRSSLAVPLTTTGGIIGVLNLESAQPDFFTEQDAAFVNSLSGHAAISIANANLLEERQYQIQTLTYLRRLTLDATAATTQRDVTRAILQTAIDMLNGSEVALYHYSPSAGEIVLMSALRWNRDFLIEAYPRLPDAILYEVARRGIMEIVDDTAENRFYTDSVESSVIEHRSALIVPVRRRGKVREVLCIFFPEPRQFAMREVNTVELLAAQAASHLDNAELNNALRTSNDQMRAILDANHDGIILLDHTGRVMDSNVAAADILGIPLDQHINESLVNLLLERARNSDTASREELENMARLYRLDPQRVTGRDYTLDRGGQPIHIREIGTPVTDHENRTIGRLLLLRDISDEYELNQYRNKIQSMVLHDLRGPLSSIISSMYLGLTVIERDDEDARESLQTTLEVSLESAKNLLTLVESLRDIPRLEQGQIKLKRNYHSLREICESAHESLAASLRDSNQDVLIEIPDELNMVYVDDNIFRRVFINLLHNAYKFSPSDEPILIRAEESNQPNRVNVLVCDNGPGIPPEMRQRIFTEFEQIAELRPHRGGRGSGLGLTFCKLALDAHGGAIYVAQEGPTKGACFTLQVPTQPESP